MLFCSEEFLFLFLPVFFLIYFFVPAKWKNPVLFVGSLVFYFTGERNWFLLMLLSLMLHFAGTWAMQGKRRRVRIALLVFLLLYDFGTLFFFKYVNLLFPQWGLTLPLGISFYTFQIAAYAIDMYRSEEPAAGFLTLGTYLSMFPQLIAGPIVLFGDVKQQLKERRVALVDLEEGLKVFVIGLSYKMLIANILGNLWNEIQVVGIESISGAMAWLGALAYAFQLYFDFNGYSLMAIGLGLMLGIRLPRNFRQPYLAVSVTDFWRRWHITLSGWFRQYLYIPLGGSRKGTGRTVRNLLIVWVFTGIWHGAGWTFLVWGLYYFVFLALEKFCLGGFLEKHEYLSRFYTLLVVIVGWVIFGLEDMGSVGVYLKKMFGFTAGFLEHPGVTMDSVLRYGPFFVLAVLCSTRLVEVAYKSWKDRLWLKLGLLALFWLCVYRITTAAGNPFLYFRF